MLKAELRKYYLEKRKNIDIKTINSLSLDVADILFKSFDFSKKTVHVFLPITNQNELNTWIIVDRIQSIGKIVISTSNFEDYTMQHFLLEKRTLLIENKYGIPEPSGDLTPIALNHIDIVLIPLLAFDKKGHRVGYGKGFYDRFLSKLPATSIKIGLSLFEIEKESIDDTNLTDVTLDYCITPNILYTFDK